MTSQIDQLSSLQRKLFIVTSLAIALSIYALYVEIRHDFSPSYIALCDISSSVSCSAAFLSKYGHGFGLLPDVVSFRNPIYGLAFYSLLLGLISFGTNVFHAQLVFGLAILSNLSTIYLAYILAFVLNVACVVCISIYIINFVIMIFAYRWKIMHTETMKRRRQQQSKRQ